MIAEIFADLRASSRNGQVPDILRTMSLRPDFLEAVQAASTVHFTDGALTLPIADGVMEIGSKVPLDELKNAMEDWFRRKSYLAKGSRLIVS